MVAGMITKYQTGAFAIEVDQTSVQQLLTMSQLAVSPPQLVIFLNRDVQPWLAERILERFAYNGIEVDWLPLKESTLRIRHAMGQYDDWAINDRTSEMLEHLLGNHETSIDPLGASLAIPGDSGDEVMTKKLRTAQEGHTEFNPLMGDVTYTPPRPVLAISAYDEKAIMVMLMNHIMNLVGFLSSMGSIV